MNYIKTCKEIIKTPSDFYRKMSTAEGYTHPSVFVSISYLIYGILIVLADYGRSKIGWDFTFIPMTGIPTIGGLYSWRLIILNNISNMLGWDFIFRPSAMVDAHSWSWVVIFFVFISVILIYGIGFTFITGAVQYPIYKRFGGTGSEKDTLSVMYYTTAVMVLSWIPIIGLILSIYSLYLNIVGGMIVHKVSMWKSTVAVLSSIVLSTIIILALFTLCIAIVVYLINGEFRWN